MRVVRKSQSTRKIFQMTGSSQGDLFHELLHWVRKIELGPPRSESVGIAAYLHTTLSYGFIMRFLYSESCFLSLLHTMVLNHSFYRNSSMSYLKEIKSVIFGYLRFKLQIGFNFLWKHKFESRACPFSNFFLYHSNFCHAKVNLKMLKK